MDKELIFKLPKLGESIVSATVIQWFKQVGDFVEKDEPLLEVSTDKVNSEIPSPQRGILLKILAEKDQEIDVGHPLGILSTAEKSKEDFSKNEKEIPSLSAQEPNSFLSPVVLKLAQDKGLSLEQIRSLKGTGEGGRLTKKDIENYQQESSESCQHVEKIKMSTLRKAIAENMVRSFYEAPHASLITEVDVTAVLQLISQQKQEFMDRQGVKLTITSFVIRALEKALRKFPLMNSSLQGETIMVKKQVNVGIAVHVDQGILVPVIKQCEALSLEEIAKHLSTLSQRAREHQLKPEDVKDGTITLTNFGMTGVQIGIPIIRYPEVAIVGMGSIQKKVVVSEENEFLVRSLMHLTVTFDHRVLDGIYGCGFLNELKENLEKDLFI